MSSNPSKKKLTGTITSSHTRLVSASKQKGKPPPSQGQFIVEEQMNRNEKMLLDQASEMRAEINRLGEENERLEDEIRNLKEENTGLKAKFSKNEQVENSDNVMDRSHFEKQLSDLKNENEEIKTTIKGKNAEILKLQKDLKDANEQNRNSEESFRIKLSQKENQLTETKLQLAMYRNRLQKLFGERILSKQNVTDQQAQEQTTNFEKELKEKDETIKKLQEKCNGLQEQIDRQKSEKGDTEKRTAPNDNKPKDLTRELNEANQKCKEAESKVEELQNQLSSREKKIQDLNRQIADGKSENEGLKEKISKLSDNGTMKAEKRTTDTKERQLKSKYQEIESLKDLETLKRNEDQLKSKSEEIESLRKELETLKKNEAEQLKRKNKETDSLWKELEKLKSDNASLKVGKQTTEKEVEMLLKEIQSLKNDIAQLLKQKTSGDKNRSTSSNTDEDLQKKYEQTYKELNDAKAEISQLKNSQDVGAKIMDNNPNLPDLSDENRPTRLAEKYSELYDNEWTDAYEEVEKELQNEQDVIKHIYQSLLDVFDFCQKSSKEYSRSLESCALGLPSLTVGNRTPKSAMIGITQIRQLKEVKKRFSPFLVEDVIKNYVKNRNLKLEKKPKTENFISKCVEICWLMSSQDPPVILDTGNVKGPFDSDRYRTYTKTGKTVDFVVWPPMLLHKDGPLLSKEICEKQKPEIGEKTQTAKFISKCVEICWLMSSQDPPVILDTGNLKGPFDSDRYRTYTKTGKTVDFVVWPPLLLHKDGPLLAKGVAQGK